MADDVAVREEIRRMIVGFPESDGAYVRAADLLDSVDVASLPGFRLAILRSFTIEPLVEVLKVKCFLEGVRVELFLSEFDQYQQELIDPTSRLYQFKPDVTFVAVRLEDLCPTLFNEYARLTPAERTGLRGELLQAIAGWIDCLGRHGAGNVLLSNFLVPMEGAQGLYDTQVSDGQVSVIRALNAELVALRDRFPQLALFDLELLAGNVGKRTFCDPVQWYRMSNPYRLSAYPAYGEYLLRHLRALHGRQRKCLVLDLDDTLWGGMAGEEGMAGVTLSDTYPGNCFREFQQAILRLHDRGVILAVNSKNNPEDALEVIRHHPHMILREEHWSAIRINWKDKAENLYDIARELNLGLDALVFMDDSAAECERVRQACPEVLVVQLPKSWHAYRATVEGLSCFDQLSITAEDRLRGALYHGQAKRQALASQARTLEEFYTSLRMHGKMFRNESAHVPRIAQMTQKTNQFNLTTRRYQESEIVQFMRQGIVYSLQIQDQFGDNGIVATAIVAPRDEAEWHIDTFLMSCRVIMRTIEECLLAQIVADARTQGAQRLVSRFVPTTKNRMVETFYGKRGFTVRARQGSGETAYVLDLAQGTLPHPSPWVTITETVGSLPSPSAVALS